MGACCNGRGLGPGLEAGPSLEKCGPPRGFVGSLWLLVSEWSSLQHIPTSVFVHFTPHNNLIKYEQHVQ